VSRKYLSKEEAAGCGLYCKKDLKELFRLKPALRQSVAGEVWQGQGTYSVYDKKLCVPMLPYRKPSARQLAALEYGRSCIGTTMCSACSKRIPNFLMQNSLCEKCHDHKRLATCIHVAQGWMNSESVVLLDTETSGLDDRAEIIEISLIDNQGVTLLDTLVRPVSPIPAAATEIHGICDADVQNAPSWADIHDEFERIVAGKKVIIYNADYDVRLLAQTSALHGLPAPSFDSDCAMDLYAHWYGEEGYRGTYRWKSLLFAAEQCGVVRAGAHRSLVDCEMTLGVINTIAQTKQ